ncbi:hypothetical protein [Sphingomonas sp. TDK1]|uniref:hypothetical protein n=1 Tax=Sphingomonas sp. TDK1 TaxID=453247 RepID=UPI0007D9AB39|nr:hypothetical protein [Sphingomonas sp. TDK1]OAN63671.1 hypothetical protein A7X12_19665 [Sphingomonas sp. TDK1]
MKKFVTISLIAATALGLAACNKSAGDNGATNVEVANEANVTDALANSEATNEAAPAGNVTGNATAQ